MLQDLRFARTLIIAPHPDDDAIAAGGLIQRILCRGGEVRVVFITDGDNNPWPQRLIQRKWFLDRDDRRSWGALRQEEALCSLARFGMNERAAAFLGFPDQRIAGLARRGDLRLRQALEDHIARFDPTLVVSPSSLDLHADHRAIAWFAHAAAAERQMVTYVVHGSAPANRLACRLQLTDRERQCKREAIECHQSQLLLSRERFLSYAGATELFYEAEFDLVAIDSLIRERLTEIRHAMRVIFGGYPSRSDSGIQPAADIQHGTGDISGLL
jgi:LmbE family N-acetylglucosaminyl deacetylase